MRILSVVGTRPQLIKAAALQPALRRRFDEVFVDTGQHWDDDLAGSFFRELGLARPDHQLGIGGGTAADQVSGMVDALAPIIGAERPAAVLVYGDTNSTLAGALAARAANVPLAHVEAGLRSFDLRMPEEINRTATDHMSRWLFAPTPAAVANLSAEGITAGVTLVGDVMQDLAARTVADVRDPAVLDAVAISLAPAATPIRLEPGRYLYATVHRAANREPAELRALVALLAAVARPDRPVVFAIHPGTRAAIDRLRIDVAADVRLVPPQGYRTSLALQLHAAAVLTDSGGVQREAAWLDVPCLILRDRTEWVEAVAGSGGRMVLVGLDAERAAREVEGWSGDSPEAMAARGVRLTPAGAIDRIVAILDGPDGP